MKLLTTIGISKEHVGYILHEELDMKKLCTRWVPRLLTADQKRTRMKILFRCFATVWWYTNLTLKILHKDVLNLFVAGILSVYGGLATGRLTKEPGFGV